MKEGKKRKRKQIFVADEIKTTIKNNDNRKSGMKTAFFWKAR